MKIRIVQCSISEMQESWLMYYMYIAINLMNFSIDLSVFSKISLFSNKVLYLNDVFC